MINRFFVQLLNMSFTASIVTLFVLVIRLFLKKSPKIFSYSLWSVVLFRLICPFSFNSMLSLLPTKTNIISQNIVHSTLDKIDTDIPAINNALNIPSQTITPETSINPLQIWILIGSIVWITGICFLLSYSFFNLLKLKRHLKNATYYKDNIYYSDKINTAFVMGIISPKIYLPTNLLEKEKEYILLHEQTHIKHFDHIIKIISFIVLCFHWFNPLVWISFFLSGKDMEMACDETVIKKLGNDVKKDYSTSLLSLTMGKRLVGGTPLAFGEGNTKQRIKNILNYKKPTLWVIVTTCFLVICIITGLMLNPKDNNHVKNNTNNLWKSRTQYVGDNTAVGNIISQLEFPNKLKYNSFQLFTNESPYGITVYFKTDTQTKDYYADVKNEFLFQKNAIMFFSLIENVENITFSLDDNNNIYTINYTRNWAENIMSNNNLFKTTETIESYNKLIKEIPITVNKENRLKDVSSSNNDNAKHEKALATLMNSINYKNNKIFFTIPQSYLPTSNWNILIAGRSELDGMGMSVHLFEEENNTKSWKVGQTYSIDIKDKGYTSLSMDIYLPNDIEQNIDLLSYIPDRNSNNINIVFPAYEQKSKNSSKIFDINPFFLLIKLPDDWEVKMKQINDTKYPLTGVWNPLGIYNEQGEYIGALGYNIYESKDDIPQKIYNQIALGNNYKFDAKPTESGGNYTPILESKNGITAITKVNISANFAQNLGYKNKPLINKGILSYNKDLRVYIAIELDDKISDVELLQIAKSIKITPKK